MATQHGVEIPFGFTHDQLSFKLLELPTELLALLESDNPPCLHLKTGASGNAQLITPSKTYRIQQKNTSNPIMVLAPSTTASIHQASDANVGIDAESAVSQASVAVISTIQDTLELLEGEEGGGKAVKKVNKWHEKFGKGRTGGKSS